MTAARAWAKWYEGRHGGSGFGVGIGPQSASGHKSTDKMIFTLRLNYESTSFERLSDSRFWEAWSPGRVWGQFWVDVVGALVFYEGF